MWIIQEPKKVALWNKRHFEEKNGECAACLKYSVLIYVEKKYKKCNIWRVAVCSSNIWDARFLKVKHEPWDLFISMCMFTLVIIFKHPQQNILEFTYSECVKFWICPCLVHNRGTRCCSCWWSHRAANQKVASLIHWNFWLAWAFWLPCGSGVNWASNRNKYQGCLLGCKGDWCLGLRTLQPSCANCLEISGTLAS